MFKCSPMSAIARIGGVGLTDSSMALKDRYPTGNYLTDRTILLPISIIILDRQSKPNIQ